MFEDEEKVYTPALYLPIAFTPRNGPGGSTFLCLESVPSGASVQELLDRGALPATTTMTPVNQNHFKPLVTEKEEAALRLLLAHDERLLPGARLVHPATLARVERWLRENHMSAHTALMHREVVAFELCAVLPREAVLAALLELEFRENKKKPG